MPFPSFSGKRDVNSQLASSFNYLVEPFLGTEFILIRSEVYICVRECLIEQKIVFLVYDCLPLILLSLPHKHTALMLWVLWAVTAGRSCDCRHHMDRQWICRPPAGTSGSGKTRWDRRLKHSLLRHAEVIVSSGESSSRRTRSTPLPNHEYYMGHKVSLWPVN